MKEKRQETELHDWWGICRQVIVELRLLTNQQEFVGKVYMKIHTFTDESISQMKLRGDVESRKFDAIFEVVDLQICCRQLNAQGSLPIGQVPLFDSSRGHNLSRNSNSR